MSDHKPDTKHCNYNTFKRARYFHGMLMTDRDFREEQIYHNEKRKLLNRMLHGWGVVCGFDIQWEAGKSVVVIKRGMALDCHGNEIMVCDPVDIDLASMVCPTKVTPRGAEEYCKQQDVENKPTVYYIGIRYNEVPTDPVPVYVPGGGCEEKVCEYSRIREGFCVEIFDHKPCQPVQRVVEPSLLSQIVQNCEKVTGDSRKECEHGEVETFANKFCQNPLPCPDCCPEEHFIILGSFTLDQNNQTITKLNLNSGRSYVPTIHLFRYLFSSLANDIDTFFKEEMGGNLDYQVVPDVNLIHTNPVEALCWLRRVFIGGVNIQSEKDSLSKMLNKKTAAKPPVDPEVAKLRKELDVLKSEVQKLKKG